jgi:hypothetical protein
MSRLKQNLILEIYQEPEDQGEGPGSREEPFVLTDDFSPSRDFWRNSCPYTTP